MYDRLNAVRSALTILTKYFQVQQFSYTLFGRTTELSDPTNLGDQFILITDPPKRMLSAKDCLVSHTRASCKCRSDVSRWPKHCAEAMMLRVRADPQRRRFFTASLFQGQQDDRSVDSETTRLPEAPT